jgi:6-phosphogluconolactonase
VIHRELEVLEDAEAVARRAAASIAERARKAIAGEGRFTIAVSGGRTPWRMFAHLSQEDVDWNRVALYQVDERIGPDGDPDRSMTKLRESFARLDLVQLHEMPVTAENLDLAAAAYAATLPSGFDLVHLGLGPDGHTASLVPGDAVLDVDDRDVAITGEYQGRRRMTLTFRALDRAAEVLWVVTGSDKVDALHRLLVSDTSIPAGRVATAGQLVLADRAASPGA